MAVQPTWIKNIDGSTWNITTCPKSCRLIYPAAATLADVMDTLESYITSTTAYGTRGWTYVSSSVAGTLRCYTAPNRLDINSASSVKTIHLDCATAGYLLVKTYESSTSATPPVGTNLAYGSDLTTNAPRITLASGGSLYICCTSEYLMVHGGLYNMGCYELERANATDDTVGYGVIPVCQVTQYGLLDIGFSTGNGISRPRTRSGATGASAGAGNIVVSTPFGSSLLSNSIFSSNIYPYTTAVAYPNNWTGKTLTSDIICSIAGANIYEYVGRILGLKLVCTGYLMDEISIKIDSLGYVDPSGTATTHLIFKCSGAGRLALPK
jgi:hypothetical protein